MLSPKNISGYCILLLACYLAVACSKKEPHGKGGGTEETGDAYISFSINTGYVFRNGTRSTEVEGLDWGRDEESYVANVMAVLYSESSDHPAYVFEFDIRSREQGDADKDDWVGFVEDGSIDPGEAGTHLYKSDNKYHLVTFARRVKRQRYSLMVIINRTDEIRDGFVNQRWTSWDYNRQAVGIAEEHLRDKTNGGIAEDKYFLMTNHQGAVPITPADLMPSADEANEEPISVKLSRAVAKVTLEDHTPEVTGGEADNFSWGLDATNKMTYRQRQMTFELTSSGYTGEEEKYGDFEFNYADPAAILRHLKTLYAYDPNFENYSQYGYSPDNAWNKDNHFNYLTGSSPLKRLPGEYDYCLENTMMAEDQFADVATGVVIRCRYTPVPLAPDESYFVFGGYLIDEGTMQEYIDTPANIPDALRELKLAESIRAANLTNATGLTESFESHSIRYYHRGINYYRMIIEHAEIPDTGIEVPIALFYGRYGVVRNNYYKLKVTGIKGPGSPVIATADRQNIAGTVSINGWYERNSEIEWN